MRSETRPYAAFRRITRTPWLFQVPATSLPKHPSRIGRCVAEDIAARFPTLLTMLVAMGVAAGAAAQTVPLAHFLTVDVAAVPVSGSFLVDGVSTPPDEGELAELSVDGLFGPGTEAAIGTTPQQTYGPTWLIEGRYVPNYAIVSSATGLLPLNTRTAFGAPVEVDGSTPLDFDIPTVDVTLELQMNGGPFPSGAGELALISLRDRETGSEFAIGFADGTPMPIRVLPGVYDVVYTYVSGGALPVNSHAIVHRAADFRLDGSLVIDIPSFVHSVGATLNGAPFPSSIYEDGEIRLENLETGDVVSYGLTSAPTGPQRLIAGTYAATWSHDTGNTIVPLNSHAVIASGLDIQPPAIPGQLSFSTVDVVAHPTTFDATLDGVAFPSSLYERGDLVLVGANGDEVPLGSTHQASAPIRVIPGTYDVHYRWVAGNVLVPANRNARLLAGRRITAPATLVLDIETVEILFDFRLDGLTFPTSLYERGVFSLVGDAPGDVMDAGSSHNGVGEVRVLPGTYDLFYDHVAGGLVPGNRGQRAISDLEFLVDQAVTVDVASRLVVPTFALNGASFPDTRGGRAAIVLRNPDGGELPLGETDAPALASVLAFEGPYGIDYEWLAGVDVPVNTRHRVGYTTVPEPGFGAAVAFGGCLLAWRKRNSKCSRSDRQKSGRGRPTTENPL